MRARIFGSGPLPLVSKRARIVTSLPPEWEARACVAMGKALGPTPSEDRCMITLTRLVTMAALVTTIACANSSKTQPREQADAAPKGSGTAKGGQKTMQIYYLEIVTKEVDAVCAAYAAANGVKFGEPDAGLGKARTAPLPGGGLVGVRAPLRDNEEPIVRPYWLVDDIEAAVAAAVKAGGVIAHPPMKIPGHGTFAIYIQGGINHGFWQREIRAGS